MRLAAQATCFRPSRGHTKIAPTPDFLFNTIHSPDLGTVMNSMNDGKFSVSCNHCGLNGICLPQSLTDSEMSQIDEQVKRGKPLHRGDKLFEMGDDFHAFYAVRSGAIKAYAIDDEGDEQVVGFFLPGEILGLDSIAAGKHVSTARALETTAVCEIPFDQVETLSQRISKLQSQMYRMLSKEIHQDHELHMLLSKKTAEERIAAFLMNLSLRYERRRLSSSRFRLPMARTDIGNYLGLAVETVSRVFTRLQGNGILQVDGKELEILDKQRLCHMAHQEEA